MTERNWDEVLRDLDDEMPVDDDPTFISFEDEIGAEFFEVETEEEVADDHVLDQHRDLFLGLDPTHRVLVAVLDQAFRDLHAEDDAMRADALAWIACEDDTPGPGFSFVGICHALHLDPSATRKRWWKLVGGLGAKSQGQIARQSQRLGRDLSEFPGEAPAENGERASNLIEIAAFRGKSRAQKKCSPSP